MNKSDTKLIGSLLLIIIMVMLFMQSISTNNPKEAYVYYDNNLVLKIDLDIEALKEYEVNGYNGKVKIQTQDGRVRVVDEISPLHICSYQGWIDSSYETIVCLPNKVVIKIFDKKNEIDTVVR
jgi:hypothetical protein